MPLNHETDLATELWNLLLWGHFFQKEVNWEELLNT